MKIDKYNPNDLLPITTKDNSKVVCSILEHTTIGCFF